VNLRSSIARPALLVSLLFACGGEDLVLPEEGQPASIAILQGNQQIGRVGEPLAESIVARVTDSRGRPVTAVPVALTLADGAGGESTPSDTRTGGDGTAAFQVVLGSRVGPVEGAVAILTSEGVPTVRAPLRFTAVSASAAGVALVSGDGQSAAAGSRLERPLVVQVADAFGNPIRDVTIAWQVDGGGSVSAESVPTDADGRASVERTLGPTAGVQQTRASASGLAGSPVTFVHTATAGSAARLEAASGNGQSAVVGTPVPEPLVVRLLDPAGNPVAGTAVTWVVGQGGGTLAPETGPTDDAGRAATRWTLGSAAGVQTVTAVVSGVGVVGFTATAVPGAPPGLRVATQPAATARRGVTLSRQPVIQLMDPTGTDLRQGGVAVAVAVAAGGGRLLGTLTRTTDADGRAAFSGLALEGPAGRYTLAFGAAGYSAAVSTPVELSRSITTTTIGGDDPDPSAPGGAVRVVFTVVSPGGRPSGNVTVRAEDGATCNGAVSAGACSLTLTAAGSQRLRAAYEGDAEFEPSEDVEDHQVQVRAAATTLRIESDTPDPSSQGEPVAVRVSVQSDGGTPAGTVTVSADGGASCTAQLTGGGGSCTLTPATAGRITLTAVYPGNASFLASSATESHEVRTPEVRVLTIRTQPSDKATSEEPFRRQPEVQLALEGGGSVPQAGVTVRAAITSGSGTLLGTAAMQTNGDGRARFTDLAIAGPEGRYALGFSADGYRAVASEPIEVILSATQTEITRDDPDPSAAGEAVEVEFRVRSQGRDPGGSVTVSAGPGGPTCSGQLSRGEGRCTLILPQEGEITLIATFPGGSGYAGSTDEERHRVRAGK
jgi:hypothetical protein